MPYLQMLAGSFAFALMGAFAHRAGESYSWPIVAFVRSSTVLAVSAIAVRAGGVRFVFPGPRMLWIRSLAGSGSLLCTFFALTHLPVSNALTLTNTFPLWVALLSWPLLGKLPRPSTWIALILAIFGVVLIENPEAGAFSAAAGVALAGALATAVAMLGLNRLRAIDPRAIMVHFAGVSLPFCLAAGLILGREPLNFSTAPIPLLSLFGAGAMATVGQYFLTLAFSRADAGKVSIVGLSQVVFALAFEYFWWNRRPDSGMMLGVGLILVPTGWVIWNGRRAIGAPLIPAVPPELPHAFLGDLPRPDGLPRAAGGGETR